VEKDVIRKEEPFVRILALISATQASANLVTSRDLLLPVNVENHKEQ
jgi:hypothetical protein